MTSIITIFDHFMKRIDEIEAPTTPRGWILNEYGRCEFSLGFDVSNPDKVTLRNLQFGNLIHVRHIPQIDVDGNEKGSLPDWIGIILPDRSWELGIIHVTAYQAESILAFRAMPYIDVKGSPLTVMQKIINAVHQRANNIIFQPGILDDVSSTFADDLRTNAYDHIRKLISNSGMDWSVTGDISSRGSLDLYVNLFQRKGIDTNLVLETSINAEMEEGQPLLTEQGTPSNQVFGHSDASTNQSRFEVMVTDQESYDDYGALQLNQVYAGIHDKASVTNASQVRVKERSRPVRLVRRIALDYQNTFDYLETGNTVIVKETGVGFNPDGGFGFEGHFKIITMDYNELSNKVVLNVKEVL